MGESAEPRSIASPAFQALVMSLGASALAPPEAGAGGASGGVDREHIRQTIDLLEALELKTRGNLTPEEAQLLEHLLFDLRMRFLQAPGPSGGV
ncbi:MAG: DUF1844 domain-containing protein [Candidatus Methylomirabilales bacterium]